jgi:uncharacterized protein (DUF58 family)
MKNLKIILIAVAVILCALVALSVVGMIINALYYVFWLGVLALGGVAAYKLFAKSNDAPQLEGKTPARELETADRELEKYKEKYLLK